MSRSTSKMSQADAVERLERLTLSCRERALRLTPQRRALLETLVESGDHPSAEQIYLRVRGKLPGVSRATVFRVLEQLVAKGVIGRASHLGRSARYDVRTDLHHHLICLHCDSMIDIVDDSLDSIDLPDTTSDDFEVIDFRVQLRGYCKKCQRQVRKGDGR